MGRAKNRKHPCPPFWQAMDSMRNGTAMLAWWRSGLRATPSVGPADPLAVAADPARAPHPGVAGALIDEVPAAALRLAEPTRAASSDANTAVRDHRTGHRG